MRILTAIQWQGPIGSKQVCRTNEEIAYEVYLSDKTVKNYVSSILTKPNLRRRSEAPAFIVR